MNDTIQSLPQERMAVPMPEWGPAYLAALDEAQGSYVGAAKLMGKSYDQVYYARQKCEILAREVEQIKAKWDSHHLALLEDVSLAQAMKPGCFPERAFRMKRFDPSYRDRQQGLQVGGINIVFGFTMSGRDEQKMEIPAKVLPTNGRNRQADSDILSDEDLDF